MNGYERIAFLCILYVLKFLPSNEEALSILASALPTRSPPQSVLSYVRTLGFHHDRQSLGFFNDTQHPIIFPIAIPRSHDSTLIRGDMLVNYMYEQIHTVLQRTVSHQILTRGTADVQTWHRVYLGEYRGKS